MAGRRINTGRNPNNGDPWAPYPPRGGPAGRWFGPGNAVGTQSLDAAVGQLNFEHPWHVQGERLQSVGCDAIHRPVQSSTYGGRQNLPNGNRASEARGDWSRWRTGY